MQWRHNDCASRGLKWTCGRCTRLRYRGSKRARYRLVERSNRRGLPAMSFSAFISVPNGGLEFAHGASSDRAIACERFRDAVAGARGRGGERGENRRRRSGRMRRDPRDRGAPAAGGRRGSGHSAQAPRTPGRGRARGDHARRLGAPSSTGARRKAEQTPNWPPLRKSHADAHASAGASQLTYCLHAPRDTHTQRKPHTSRPAAHLTQNI